MLASTPEDKAYYAQKAAAYEHDMVKREIETAWLVSEAMSEMKLSGDMRMHTDRLTGVDTATYTAERMKAELSAGQSRNWQPGDSLVIYIDEGCSAECLKGVSGLAEALPEQDIRRILVVRSTDKTIAVPEQAEALTGISALESKTYDAIEHKFLDGYAPNTALHIRNGQVVRELLRLIPATANADSRSTQ